MALFHLSHCFHCASVSCFYLDCRADYLLLDVKSANFLLRVESQSTSSASSASAPSPSATAAGTNAKINSASASVSAGVAGEVDSAAAVSAALRLGIVAIDYGDHFDLAALSRDVDKYAQQCSTTSASFKRPGKRVMQLLRGCTDRFTVSRLADADAHSARMALRQQQQSIALIVTRSLTHSARLCCALCVMPAGVGSTGLSDAKTAVQISRPAGAPGDARGPAARAVPVAGR